MSEIFEDFSIAQLGQPLPPEFDGWKMFFGSHFTVLQDGDHRVLVGMGTDNTSKRMLQPIIEAGGFGRVEAKLKLSSNVAADYSAQNNFAAMGFVMTDDPQGVTVANKRVLQLTYESNGSNVGLKFWNGAANTKLVDITAIPVNTWLVLGVAFDGKGRYTAYVVNETTGAVLGSGGFTIAADAGKAMSAYVDMGWNQKTQDAQGWGTQYKWTDIIARDDFLAYEELTQRRPLYLAPTVNGGDICYIVVPKDWDGVQQTDKVVLAGHGYNAQIGFSTMLNKPLADAGYVYGQSNTHGNTWGNSQATDDIEAMRQWIAEYLGASGRVYLYGASMGSLVALNYYARFPDKVKKIVTEIGVASLQPMYKQTTYQQSIKDAYGVTRFGDIPATFDPIRNPERYVKVPIMSWVGTADTVAVPAFHTRLFTEKIARLGGTTMYIEEPGETHNLDVDPGRYIDFFEANEPGSLTKLLPLRENVTYKIAAPADSASYLIDAKQGTLTNIGTTTDAVRAQGRPRAILVKLKDPKAAKYVTVSSVQT